MTPLLLALTSALSWGVSDFLGGVGARRVSLPVVLAGSQIAGAAVVVPLLVVYGPAVPPVAQLLPGLVAGVVATAELGLLYLALRQGPTVVAAQVAALGAILPVAVGIVGGDVFDWTVAIGVGCALAGAAGASWPPPERRPTRRKALASAGTALGAAAGAGAVLTLIAQASRTDPWWTVGAVHLAGTAAAVATLAVITLARRRRSARSTPVAAAGGHPSWRTAVVITTIGFADLGADLAFANAARIGPLDIIAVLASLYPVATVALGVLYLHERPSRIQGAGAVLACAAIAILATNR